LRQVSFFSAGVLSVDNFRIISSHRVQQLHEKPHDEDIPLGIHTASPAAARLTIKIIKIDHILSSFRFF